MSSATIDTIDETAPQALARRSGIADPMPIAFGLFAFALAVYGVRFVNVDAATIAAGPITVGLNYAVLAGGIGEALAGLLGIIRGDGYPAYIVSTFGIWLLGFFFLVNTGSESKEFTPNALAWYVLFLVIPVAIMAVPAIVHRNIPFVIAFVALIALLLLLGIGYHETYNQVVSATKNKTAPNLGTAVDLLKVSAYAGFVAAAALWFVFAKEIYLITGVLKPRTTE